EDREGEKAPACTGGWSQTGFSDGRGQGIVRLGLHQDLSPASCSRQAICDELVERQRMAAVLVAGLGHGAGRIRRAPRTRRPPRRSARTYAGEAARLNRGWGRTAPPATEKPAKTG